ncbi:MAG: hypothetical protein NVS9B12_05500 [Vulcanimicrobiaceae bacterium]
MDRASRFSAASSAAMGWAERAILVLVGLALFAVAGAFLFRTALAVPALFDANTPLLPSATAVLNNVLLILMLVELVYTVTLSLRGIMLSAEPFLIVGMIATIRRMLVITIGESNSQASHANELLILTAVLIAFVASIFLLNLRSRARARVIGQNVSSGPGGVLGEIHAKH